MRAKNLFNYSGKTVIMLIFLGSNLLLNAQITRKIEYEYLKKREPGFGIALLGFIPSGYKLENDIKVRGVDDSLNADNIYKVILVNDSIHLYDVSGVSIVDSNAVIINATYYIYNYNLSPEQQNKKQIVIKNSEGANAFSKVYTDSAGKKYVKDWVHSGNLLIRDEQLIKISVKNSNYWVNSTLKKNNMLFRNQIRQTVISIPAIVGGIYAFYLLINNYRSIIIEQKYCK